MSRKRNSHFMSRERIVQLKEDVLQVLHGAGLEVSIPGDVAFTRRRPALTVHLDLPRGVSCRPFQGRAYAALTRHYGSTPESPAARVKPHIVWNFGVKRAASARL